MRRFILLLVVCAAGLTCLGAPRLAHAQPDGDEESATEIHVIHLAHAPAEEVHERIGDVAGLRGVEMSVDSRTNCVILSGDSEGIQAIVALCDVLDTAPQVIDAEIAIYELRGETAEREFAPEELENAEDVRMIRRIRLQSLEGQMTMIQLGETVPVKSGETFNRGGAPPQATYQMENLGTLVNYTARVSDDTITMQLSVESSRLLEAEESDAGNEYGFPSRTTGQLQSTVILRSGEPMIVGDFTSADSPDDTRFVVVVTASAK